MLYHPMAKSGFSSTAWEYASIASEYLFSLPELKPMLTNSVMSCGFNSAPRLKASIAFAYWREFT